MEREPRKVGEVAAASSCSRPRSLSPEKPTNSSSFMTRAGSRERNCVDIRTCMRQRGAREKYNNCVCLEGKRRERKNCADFCSVIRWDAYILSTCTGRNCGCV